MAVISRPASTSVKEVDITSGSAKNKQNSARKLSDGEILPSDVGTGYPQVRSIDISIAAFARQYNDLVQRAINGDPDAAYQLYLGTKQCRDVSLNRENFNAYLDDARDFSGIPEDEEVVRQQTQRFEDCQHLTPQQRSSVHDWLERAAELGDSKAKSAYILTEPDQTNTADFYIRQTIFREKSRAYIDDLSRTGNPDDLMTISLAYSGNSSIYPYDPVKMYAYRYALARAKGAASTGGPMIDRLAIAQEGMTANQINDAIKMGENIFRRCCVN